LAELHLALLGRDVERSNVVRLLRGVSHAGPPPHELVGWGSLILTDSAPLHFCHWAFVVANFANL